MTQSAISRREATAYRITLCAQQLTDERGLDGFTMDDLATAADVSRRTLFNYFPGKVDAVLGPMPELEPAWIETFRAGGPEGDLIVDLRALIVDLLEDSVSDREVLDRVRRILRSTPRLMAAVHSRYEALSAQVVELIVTREGPTFSASRARVAVTILAALLDAALDAFLADDSTDDLTGDLTGDLTDGGARPEPFTHYFDESLRTARSLLGV